MMVRNPNLDMPLTAVMRSEIALPLQQVMKIYTVGNLLSAWRSPKQQKSIEQLFETPGEARQAVAVCASWVNGQSSVLRTPMQGWWVAEEEAGAKAS